MGVIHGQGSDSVACLDADFFERLPQLSGVSCDLSPAGAGDRPVRPGRDDLAVAMLALGMIDELRDAQRPVLHCSKLHGLSPLAATAVWLAKEAQTSG